MTMALRRDIYERKPGCLLKWVVECDEVYLKAGHKGHSEAVRAKIGRDGGEGAEGRSRSWHSR